MGGEVIKQVKRSKRSESDTPKAARTYAKRNGIIRPVADSDYDGDPYDPFVQTKEDDDNIKSYHDWLDDDSFLL